MNRDKEHVGDNPMNILFSGEISNGNIPVKLLAKTGMNSNILKCIVCLSVCRPVRNVSGQLRMRCREAVW